MAGPPALTLTTFPPPPAVVAAKQDKRINLLLWACCLFLTVLAVQYFLKIQHAPTAFGLSALEQSDSGSEAGNQHLGSARVSQSADHGPDPGSVRAAAGPLGAMAWFVCKALLTLLAIRWVWRITGCLGETCPTVDRSVLQFGKVCQPPAGAWADRGRSDAWQRQPVHPVSGDGRSLCLRAAEISGRASAGDCRSLQADAAVVRAVFCLEESLDHAVGMRAGPGDVLGGRTRPGSRLLSQRRVFCQLGRQDGGAICRSRER